MSRLAPPRDRPASRRAPPWSRPKAGRVFQNRKGAESEPGSDFSSGVTSDASSDFTDVTSDVASFSLVPPSPGALEEMEQGTLGAVVGGAESRVPAPLCAFLTWPLPPGGPSSLVSEAPVQT